MGKDHLAEQRDQWVTRQTAERRAVMRPPAHPRFIQRPTDYTRSRSGARVFSFASFRVISPILVPFLLSLACFTLLLLLSIGGAARLPFTVDAAGLGPAFFIYAALGVIMAASLAYAPNDAIWALAMIAGLIGFGGITIWAIFGPFIASLLLFGLFALLFAVVRRQMHMVLEDTVHVTVLFGKRHRTLRPGFNLRLPGEQVWAIINTAEVAVEVHLTEASLAGGEVMEVAVAAACRVTPEHANLAASHGNAWVEHVRHSLELVLREALGEMTAAELLPQQDDWSDLGASDPLAVRLRGKLQQLVGGWGISILWVRPYLVRAATALPTAERSLTTLHASQPDIASGPQVAVPVTAGPLQSLGALRLPDVVAMRGVTPGALLPLPPAMQSGTPAPEALAEAYAAVRERRISDPATITRIAVAFERVASNPVLAPHLPFDAAEAARNLRALASKLSG
jgi:hypothetical protein